ncbi:lysophospholipase [Gracilibacillus boraciitolerans JCM 21714]|uniref:Lysophospholipase n=1 Tax=Gracilibacillus boraciitolerans JCM 21714 TaxID=1298598 RepID=W4VGX4_9BACI|nr:alpha/beta hydrolase [Gracilibacillus boraciitolerans]GAE92004.1 lysophospholipase [Gracilibacillus boraciitolerans JCM 21714]
MDTTNYYIAIDKVKLFYRSWIPERPKAIIILIHGAGEHSGRYTHISNYCMSQQMIVISPDLRGFGNSGGSRGHVHTFNEYLDDLHLLIQQVCSIYPDVPIFLFGHSLGGLIVIRYVQEYALQTNGIIVSSPAFKLRVQLPFMVKQILSAVSRFSPGLSVQPTKWKRLADKFQILEPYLPKERALQKDPLITAQYTARWLTELMRNGIQALSEAYRFSFPLFCVYDHKDPIVHPPSIQLFLDSIAIDDKNLLSFNDGFHHPWHAHYRDKAIDHLMVWLHQRI